MPKMVGDGYVPTVTRSRRRVRYCPGMPIIAWICLICIFHQISQADAANSIDSADQVPDPYFTRPIENITVPIGKEAVLSCYVENLGNYKVGWMRLADQTVLALQGRVVTHASRYAVNHEESHTWRLKIRQIRESDRGCYMCQINASPMKKQLGCIDVHVPPDISDEDSSGDVVAKEGESASLFCSANGHPEPRIIWRREDGTPFQMHSPNRKAVEKADSQFGSHLNFSRVIRRQMGAYLCIASNDVPPAVSKRVFLNVHFPPESSTSTAVVSALQGSNVTIHCTVLAYPMNVNYWMKDDSKARPGQIESGRQKVLSDPRKYDLDEEKVSLYELRMSMTIKNFSLDDLGTYNCISTNTWGRANSTVYIFEMRIPTTTTTTTTTPRTTTTTTTTTTRRTTSTSTTIVNPFVGILEDFNMDLAQTPENPTLFPMHDNPYVVSKSEGAGIGYVDSYQPFHDNIYSGSAKVESGIILTTISYVIYVGVNTHQQLLWRHIR